MNQYLIGIDIAKNFDSVVIPIAECVNDYQADGRCISYLNILDLQMIEQMKYTDLARYVRKLDLHADLHGRNEILVDNTGVGEAVCDMLEDIGLKPVRIIFTGGDKYNVNATVGKNGLVTRTTHNVPKNELIDTLKIALQQGRVRIAPGIPFEDEIKKQFSHFVGKMSKSKNLIYGNDNDEVHDDIVCAFAMIVWWFMQANGARSDFRFEPSLQQNGAVMRFRGKRSKPLVAKDYEFVDTL